MHTSNAAINSAIYKTNFKDALLSNLISKATDNAYKAVGSYSSNEANINSNSLFKESGLGKIALHSAVGALSAKLSHENVAAGALSAAANEALSSILYKDTSNMSTKELEAYNNKRLLASQLIGIIAGGIANGDKGANTGYKITTSADTYNRQLHQREIDFINNKKNIESFKSKLQTTTNKIYSDDEAKSILAKAALSLTDRSFNEAYRQSLSSNDLYNIELATNFIKQSSFYNTTLDNTNAFNPNKKQYEDRYIYALNAYNNEDFYKDNLSVKTNPGILDYAKSTAYGLGGFAVGGIEGLADIENIILHPIDAINGLNNAFYHPILTAKNVNADIKEFMAENFVDRMIGDQSSINYRNYHALGENVGSLGAAGKIGQMAKNSSKLLNAGKSGKNNMPNDTKPTTTNSNNNANNWNNNGNDGIVVAGGSNIKIYTDKITEKFPDWTVKQSNKGNGIRIINPSNPQFEIRIMPGKSNSPNMAQQHDYIKIKTDKGFYDKNGNIIKSDKPSASFESHIELENFDLNILNKIMEQ